MNFFSWMNDQIFKMNWLYNGVYYFVQNILNINMDSKLGGSIHFFIYDTVKIFILLITLIFFISFIQSYFPPERTKRIIGKYNGIFANTIGALLGTLTPFCSCSSIPLFIGFTNAGLPIGVTFSFLISSPLVDLASVILLASIFSWKIAILYVIVGIILAVAGGTIIDILKLEKYVEPFVYNISSSANNVEESLSTKDRINFSKSQVKDIIKKVWLYIIIGVSIGAIIHNWIPESFISIILGKDKWYSVILATMVGIPMYADIFGVLPIAESLFYKGVGIGTVLAFTMSVVALSLPSLIMLKKVIKTKLLIVFVTIVTIGILIIGYTFNILI